MTVYLQLPGGDATPLRALYDSGAELNLINRSVIEGTSVRPGETVRKPTAMSLDDNILDLGDPYSLTLDCKDSNGKTKRVGPETFWSADFVGYDLVLGYPWLAEADPCIRFSTGTYEWFQEDAERIVWSTAEELFGELEPGEQAYLLHPKKYGVHPREHPGATTGQQRARPTAAQYQHVAAVLLNHLVNLVNTDKPDYTFPNLNPDQDSPNPEELAFVLVKLHYK